MSLGIMAESQISADCMYIEKLPTITLSEIIADTKWISATYRILKSGVKSHARKMRICGNKKGESIAWIHPSEL